MGTAQATSEPSLAFPQKGALRRYAFPRLVREIAKSKVTGSLYLLRGQTKKVVFFQDGQPVFVRSNVLGECLGRVLSAEGLITQEQCEQTLEAIRRTGKKQGELLVEMGILSEGNLRYGLAAQLRTKLYDIFSWDDGRFQFKTDARETHPGVRLDLRPEGVIIAAILARYSEERCDRLLEPNYARYVERIEGSAGLTELDLLPEERYFVECIDGSRSVIDLVSDELSELVPTPKALVWGLVQAGLVQFNDNAADKQARPEQPDFRARPSDDALAPSYEAQDVVTEYEDTPLPGALPKVRGLLGDHEDDFADVEALETGTGITALPEPPKSQAGVPTHTRPEVSEELKAAEPDEVEETFDLIDLDEPSGTIDLGEVLSEDDDGLPDSKLSAADASAASSSEPEQAPPEIDSSAATDAVEDDEDPEPPELMDLIETADEAPSEAPSKIDSTAAKPAPTPIPSIDVLEEVSAEAVEELVEEIVEVEPEPEPEPEPLAGTSAEDLKQLVEKDAGLDVARDLGATRPEMDAVVNEPEAPTYPDLGNALEDDEPLLDGVDADDDLLLDDDGDANPLGSDGEEDDLVPLDDLDDLALELDSPLEADDDLALDADLANVDLDPNAPLDAPAAGGANDDLIDLADLDDIDLEPASAVSYGGSEATFQEERDPEMVGAMRFNDAETALNEQQYPEAVTLLEGAYENGFDVAELHAMLAYARFMAAGQDLETATHAFELLDYAESMDPSLDLVFAYRGSIHQSLGEMAKAKAALSRALELNPYCELAIQIMDGLG